MTVDTASYEQINGFHPRLLRHQRTWAFSLGLPQGGDDRFEVKGLWREAVDAAIKEAYRVSATSITLIP